MKTKGTIDEMKDLLRVGQEVKVYTDCRDDYFRHIIKYIHEDCYVSQNLNAFKFEKITEIEILKDVDHVPDTSKTIKDVDYIAESVKMV